jgi:hypothetical protein
MVLNVDDIDRGQRVKPKPIASTSGQNRVLLAAGSSSSSVNRVRRERERVERGRGLSQITSPVDAVPSATRRGSDKGKSRQVGDAPRSTTPVSPMYSGPLAAAEYERMRKELEVLKKTVHDNKKLMKKQNKVCVFLYL